MTRWDGLDAVAAKLWAQGRKRRLAWPGPLQRLDLVLGGLVVAVGLGLTGLGWGGAAIERTRGFFDPPLAAPVPDPRILSDFRQADAPFADGVMLGDAAFLGRTDGTIQRYDTETELFSAESLPRAGQLIGDLSLLSQGCGDLPGAGLPPCPLGDSMFAMTNRGGLARRDGNGAWQVVLGDHGWTAPEGTPVEQADLVAWAVSSDGRWMLASAGAKGLGLFDQQSGGWATLSPQGDPAMTPVRIVYAANAFWLGGPAGLERVAPAASLVRAAVAGGEGDIFDLDLAADGGVLALRRGGCAEGCLSILSVSPRGVVSVLAGETALSPGLSQARVDHAAMQAGRLVVLGEAGVHVYDPQRRNWQSLETRPVDAYHADADGAVIQFAAASRVATVTNATLRDAREVSVPLVQILPTSGGQLLGLNRDGAVLDLSPAVPVTLGFADPGLPEGVRFVAGADVAGTLVLLGPQGVLLHDTVARRYAFQDPVSLPPALMAARSVTLRAAGTRLWAIDMASGQVFLGALGGDWPDRQVIFTPHIAMQSSLLSAQVQGDSLDIVTQTGAPYRVSAAMPDVAQPLTGTPLPRALTPKTMAASAQDLIFADDAALWTYDLSSRGWEGPFDSPDGGVADLALGQSIYALTPSGTLYKAGDQSWEAVSGEGPGAPLDRRDLTDALAADGSLYLGGDGAVLAYSPDQRRFTALWSGGRGDVRLLSTQGGEPVWTSGARLWLGDKAISAPTEAVLGAWQGPDGPIYLAQQDGRRHMVDMAFGRSCLFRGSAAPGGDLIDARNLPDGRVFVLTSAAAAIYEPALRRWTRLLVPAGQADSRVEVSNGYLLRLDAGRLRAIALGDLPRQDSCDAKNLEIKWQTDLVAKSLALDVVAGAVHALMLNGEVMLWQGGSVRPVLAAPNTAPETAALRRVYPSTDAMTFATDAALWQYDLASRLWTTAPFRYASAQVTEVDLRVGTGGPAVTLWDGNAAGWGGGLAAAGNNGLEFKRLSLPPIPAIAMPPETIVDMASNGQMLAVLGQRELALFNDDTKALIGRITLPQAERGWSLGRAQGAAQVILVDGDIDDPLAIYAIDARSADGPTPLAAAGLRYAPATDVDWALIADGGLWRIDADLVAYQCHKDGMQGCEVIAPAPITMTVDAIRAVERVEGEGSYLLQDDRLLHLGANFRLLAQVEGVAIGPEARLFQSEAEVLLWDGYNRPLYRVVNGNAVPIAPQVRAIRPSGAGFGLTTPAGLIIYEAGEMVEADPSLGALSLDRDGAIYGVTAQGVIWNQHEQRLMDPILQLSPATLAIHPGQLTLEAVQHQGWWSVESTGQVRFDWVAQCITPLPKPLLAPNGLPVGGGGGDSREARAIAQMPAPIPQPCQSSLVGALLLPADQQLLFINGTSTAPVLVTTSGEITLDATLAEVSRAPLRPLLPEAQQSRDSLLEMQRRVAVVAGRSWLAPPLIEQTSSGRLVLRGPEPNLTTSGSTSLQPWDAFDADWLGWERATQQLRIGSDGTALRLSPDQAIVDGLLLPAHPGRAAYLGNDRFAWLNDHGLWHVQIGKSIAPIVQQRFAPATGLAHGQFLVQGGSVDAVTGAASADANRFNATVGPLAFTERLRGGGYLRPWL